MGSAEAAMSPGPFIRRVPVCDPGVTSIEPGGSSHLYFPVVVWLVQ